MERAFNISLKNPLLFARMDTNDVIGGKYSTFDFENNKINIFGKATMGRKIYFKENGQN